MNLKVRYFTDKDDWLCFNHAVAEANKGVEVKTDVDDYSSEYYLGKTWCEKCYG